jgi:hypothetical protein
VRSRHPGAQTSDDGLRLTWGAAGHQQCELVSSDPSQQVLRAQDVIPIMSHLRKERISGSVSVSVVDRLEAVDVDDRDAQVLARATGVRQTAIESDLPRAPVGQPCEVVRVGHAIKPRQQPVALELLSATAAHE